MYSPLSDIEYTKMSDSVTIWATFADSRFVTYDMKEMINNGLTQRDRKGLLIIRKSY